MCGRTSDVITPVKFQVDRSKGLWDRGTQNRVFPIDFDRRLFTTVLRSTVLHCNVKLVNAVVHTLQLLSFYFDTFVSHHHQ